MTGMYLFRVFCLAGTFFLVAMPESRAGGAVSLTAAAESRRDVEEAKAAIKNGETAKATGLLNAAIKADPNNAEAFLILGEECEKEGDRGADRAAQRHSYRYALASYAMAGKLDPTSLEAFTHEGDLWFKIYPTSNPDQVVHDLGMAKAAYETALKLSSGSPEIQAKLDRVNAALATKKQLG